jgi:glycogen synthase
MRILFITAYYPPCQYGWGYMRICEQVADGLADLGHDITVLTSTYQDGPEYKSYPIHRRLIIDPDWNSNQSAVRQFFVGRKSREKQAVKHLDNLVDDFRPDIIFIWHANSLSRLMLQTAENVKGVKTVYYFANYLPEHPDEYIEYWEAVPQSKLSKIFKRPIAKVALHMLKSESKPIMLKYEHSISVSDYVRQRLHSKNLIGSDAVVIPNGIDLEFFGHSKNGNLLNDKSFKCLIAGRVAPEKGIYTALMAFVELRIQNQIRNFDLTIIGDGPERYKGQLKQILDDHELNRFVHFLPPVSVDEMPRVYSNHDILILPSDWQEPLACTMLEAMAANLLVIGTNTGGSGEVLFHERTGLVFEPGNPRSLTTQLLRIIQEPGLLPRLARLGQQEVVEHFNIQHTTKQIEQYLQELINCDEDS